MDVRDNLKIRNFSKKTIKAYDFYLSKFEEFVKRRLNRIDDETIKEFLLTLKSESSRRIALAAIKQKYPKIELKNPKEFSIKRTKTLPKILSKEEVNKMIQFTSNPKHKLLIELLYSTGLRLAEIRKLKFQDINYNQDTLFVRKGKGKKDRLTILSKRLIDKIKNFEEISNEDYIFISNRRKLMSDKTIQKVVSNAGKKAKINKRVTPHMLRHSFATHLLEQGTDIRYIQRLLGHRRLETTQIYTHVASSEINKIANPLDSLENENEDI